MMPILIQAIFYFQNIQAWQWKYHESKLPLNSGMSYSKNNNRPRFFGIGSSKLRERWWNGTDWVWSSHGKPDKLINGENLVSSPCVMSDRNVFIITNKGRLVERYWKNGYWHWSYHNKPNQTEGIRPEKCVCTLTGGQGRIFVVGKDARLYERSFSAYWRWIQHGVPHHTKISGTEIAACREPTCTRLVIHAVCEDGVLYGRYIEPWYPQLTHWQMLGRPQGMQLKSVSVGNEDGYVFVTTRENNVCHFYEEYYGYYCFGKPPLSGDKKKSLVLSKPVVVTQCSKLPPGASWYMFVYAWDSKDEKLSRVYILKSYSEHWLYLGKVKNGRYLVDAPVAYLKHGCPQGFFTEGKMGQVFEIES